MTACSFQFRGPRGGGYTGRAISGAVALLAFGVVSRAGCARGGSNGAGGGSSAECSADKDCKGTRVCQKGQCGDPSSVSSTSGTSGTSTASGPGCTVPPGGACAMTADCCSDPQKAPHGATCIKDSGGGATCHANCSSNTECNSQCCAGVTGGGSVCAAASFCTKKGIGDACSSGSECTSGTCVGWCSTTCSYSVPDCGGSNSGGSNSYGFYNFCVKAANGSHEYFPRYNTNADCAA